MFEIIEIGMNGRKNVLAERSKFFEACAYVETLRAAVIEPDADYPGCADAFLKDGRVVAVQPVGFEVDSKA